MISANPVISDIFKKIKEGQGDILLQFFLDCSVIPNIVQMANIYGDGIFDTMFKLSRTFCYSIHRERLNILDRWIRWNFVLYLKIIIDRLEKYRNRKILQKTLKFVVLIWFGYFSLLQEISGLVAYLDTKIWQI